MIDSRPALKKIIANLILTNKSRLSGTRSGRNRTPGARPEWAIASDRRPPSQKAKKTRAGLRKSRYPGNLASA
ncbi:hypothetical protein [Microcoleus sp. herbarium14]|uniref:hypothetical protein n=1 Tax=Microcoleus sp. herbarium14 TaxID=3055439 RepID=UPI002FCF978C